MGFSIPNGYVKNKLKTVSILVELALDKPWLLRLQKHVLYYSVFVKVPDLNNVYLTLVEDPSKVLLFIETFGL